MFARTKSRAFLLSLKYRFIIKRVFNLWLLLFILTRICCGDEEIWIITYISVCSSHKATIWSQKTLLWHSCVFFYSFFQASVLISLFNVKNRQKFFRNLLCLTEKSRKTKSITHWSEQMMLKFRFYFRVNYCFKITSLLNMHF